MRLIATTILITLIQFVASAVAPQVVAHRGHHRAEGSAQNSIRSLVKADSVGADACEFDVWLSADNVLYVNHNADINGVVIETSSSQQLDTCHLKNGETIPRLDTFLDTAKTLGIDLVLELKPHKDTSRENLAVPMIIDMIATKGLTDRTTYITFSRNACRLLAATSGRPVFFLAGTTPDEIKEMGATGPDFHISHFRTHPEWIDQFHSMGMPVNIWTVDSEADIQYCVAHGADFITTNEPVLTQKIIADTYAPRQLKIMTYNLRFGELASMERLAEEIKAQNPDFVALQEVDVNSFRTMAPHNNGINFVNELAYRTGLFGYFGKALNFSVKNGYYGVAILSRYPAVSVETIELPNPKNAEPRVLLKGRFQLENDLPFVFASTHFDYTSPDTQLLQARAVLHDLSSTSLPTIFAGDFNCEQGSAAIDLFQQNCSTLSGTAPTFPARKPESRLDHIFGIPKADFKLISTDEGPSSPYTASDHLPVISTILLTPESTAARGTLTTDN